MDISNRFECRWTPAIESDFAAKALAVAKEVAKRCKDREQVLAANDAALEQTIFPRTIYWEPLGVAQGDAGLALMCSYLDACFPGEGWDRTGHEYLNLAARGAETAGAQHLGLYSGLAGLAFAAQSLSRNGSRYKKLLTSLDYSICGGVLEPSAALTGRHGVAVSEFDLIIGLSGVAAYLLRRGYEPPMDVALQAILDSLVALTEETEGVPHWYTPHRLLQGEGMAEHYPEGNLNCGLAHGIPGPLAVMALGLEAGLPVEGLKEAVTRTARWLVRHRSGDSYGVNWPTVVPYSADGNVDPRQLDSSRAGWCYGTPGVARSLWLAGRALGDKPLQQVAVEGMEAVYRRPVEERRIDSPTFCHGVAGLLQVTLRFAHDTGLPVFTDAATALTEQLLSSYDPERALGFCSVEPGGNLVDQPGLLDGAPGVALVLLAASSDVEPAWDRLFLLS
ncbi:MAG: lanthionine synthetase C family protein [Betaproteobacteria bacterium]|nr:lanthionine synthetase C family protein [Betaproteobacteria bacterium]